MCFNSKTCLKTTTSDNTIVSSDNLFMSVAVEAMNSGLMKPWGIYDHENADNPMKGWTHIVVPYCTGDIHWGNRDVLHEAGLLMSHRGGVNAAAVVAWLFREMPTTQLKQALITGCSAGAYGSLLWAPHLMQHYPNANVVQFGDSGAGVINNTWTALHADGTWNVSGGGAIPNWIPGADMADLASWNVTFMYETVGAFYNTSRFSQFNWLSDGSQRSFFELTGASNSSMAVWRDELKASLSAIQSTTPNFYAYTVPVVNRPLHCIITSDFMYQASYGGVKFTTWLAQLLDGTATTVQPPSNSPSWTTGNLSLS